jgi:hypothetical protein
MKIFKIIVFLLVLAACHRNAPTEKTNKENLFLSDKKNEENLKKMDWQKDSIPSYLLDKQKLPNDFLQKVPHLPDSLQLDPSKMVKGDFNADSRGDFACLVTNFKTKEVGLVIVHNDAEKTLALFGAGQKIYDMTNLDWIGVLETIPKGEIISETLVDSVSGDIMGKKEGSDFVLIGTGIRMSPDEGSGGGILYWMGKRYNWYHIE